MRYPETCAIIPARGGSKGIPRKNLRAVAGRPLLAHAIEAARASASVGRIIVSTDDDEIASVARTHGAGVIRRPAELAGDTASSESALTHTLEVMRCAEDYRPELLVFLQCTSPLTAPEDIDGTVHALLREEADSALAVAPFHAFIWRRAEGPAGAEGVNHDRSVRPRRQDRAPEYLETGAVYVMRTEGFLRARHRFFGRTSLYVMTRERCLEIDEPADLELASAMIQARRPSVEPAAKALPRRVGALVLDFDGVFTDNRVIVTQDGREAVVCDRSDGWGLSQLRRAGLPILVLSLETNPVVQARCAKLGIECRQGVTDKATALRQWLAERAIDPRAVVYVGNDVNDVECLRAVGCGVAVADAYPSARASARVVLSRPGGRGALREVADLILERIGAIS